MTIPNANAKKPKAPASNRPRIATSAPAASFSISRAIDDLRLLGRWFSGSSWDTWRAVLKAAYGEAMSPAEVERFRCVAERDPPKKRVREMTIIAGRRTGKSAIASAIGTSAAAFRDYRDITRPGEMANIMCLAVDRGQARLVLGYIKGYFAEIPMLRQMVKRETQDGLELSTGAAITVIPNDYRTVRGRSIALAILDEACFWRSEESVSPDTETYAALVPGLATIPGSMLIAISSPHRRAGLVYDKWRESYGKPDDDVLVIRAPTSVLNPTIDPKLIEADMARDPARAKAEWLAEWRDDLASFVAPELIESAVDHGVVVRPPIPGVVYIAGIDPSGGVSDSFCCAIAHAEGTNDEVAVLDNLIEIKAPFSPIEATAQICATLKSYGIFRTVGDRYSAGFARDAFASHGVRYVHSDRDRSAIYGDVLPLFTSGRVRLLDNRRLVNQFAALERKTVAGGRDKIDHPDRSGHHDDAANAVALALIHAVAQRPRAVAHFGGVSWKPWFAWEQEQNAY